jgi:hypothetical protein
MYRVAAEVKSSKYAYSDRLVWSQAAFPLAWMSVMDACSLHASHAACNPGTRRLPAVRGSPMGRVRTLLLTGWCGSSMPIGWSRGTLLELEK